MCIIKVINFVMKYNCNNLFVTSINFFLINPWIFVHVVDSVPAKFCKGVFSHLPMTDLFHIP